MAPDIGWKLDYVFGKATGTSHNIDRSVEMLRQLQSIGLQDTPANRQLFADYLEDVLNDPGNIARTEASGRVVRDSLLMGPQGGVKLETIWDGTKLITVNIFGGR